MRPSRLSLVALPLVALGLAACGGDPSPADLDAMVLIFPTSFAERDTVSVMAMIGSDDGAPSPEEVTVTVRGKELAYDTGNARTLLFHLRELAPPDPGDPFDVVIETPGGRAELSVPMVHPTSLVALSPAIGLAEGDGLELAWTDAHPGERDWIGFRAPGYVSYGLPIEWVPEGVLEVRAGGTSIAVPAELIATWREGVERAVDGAISEPTPGTVVLLRTRAVDAAPDFADGRIMVAIEAARQPVTLLP